MSDDPNANLEPLTQLLLDAQAGNQHAYAKVYHHLYAELKQRARSELAARPANTLSATALVNETYLKLLEPDRLTINDRRHFLRICVRAMRNILIDHFRASQAEKRGGKQVKSALDVNNLELAAQSELITDIDEVLERLRRDNQRVAEVVEYKYFLGLSEKEIAEVLEITTRTVRSDWQKGRIWLARELSR